MKINKPINYKHFKLNNDMKTRLFTLAALALTMASCSQDGDNTPVDLKDTPIQVNASVSPMASLKDTKAGYEASTSLPSQF